MSVATIHVYRLNTVPKSPDGSLWVKATSAVTCEVTSTTQCNSSVPWAISVEISQFKCSHITPPHQKVGEGEALSLEQNLRGCQKHSNQAKYFNIIF